MLGGHSKNMFVEEGGALKREQKQTGGGGVLACVYVHLKKKC